MNIGFVATEVGHQQGGAFMGGNVNNVVTVSKQLAERGHDVKIITTKPRDAADEYLSPITWADTYSLDSTFSHGSPGYIAEFCAFAVRTARRLERQNELDTISVHSGFTIWGAISSLSSMFGCPSVHVQYCPINQDSGSRKYNLIQSTALSKVWLYGTDRVVGITKNVANSLKPAVSNEIDVIHNAIQTDEYEPSAADRFDLFDTEDIVIGYLGSLNPQKGLDILVDAFQSVKQDYDVTLALGLEVRSQRSNSELWNQIDSDPDIHAYGILNDVPAFLARADIFAVPFRTTVGPADYPVAALEAMACGTPPISTSIGGLPDLIKDGESGILVSRPDVGLFEEGIRSLVSNKTERERLGSNARKQIIDGFSVEVIGAAYEQLFAEVATT